MDNDVVGQPFRNERYLVAEIEIALARAASPPRLLILDEDPPRREAVVGGEFRHFLGDENASGFLMKKVVRGRSFGGGATFGVADAFYSPNSIENGKHNESISNSLFSYVFLKIYPSAILPLMKNPHHARLLASLKKHSGKGTNHTKDSAYLGNTHFSYDVSNPLKRQIIKEFIAKHREISLAEFIALLDSLFAARSYDEKSIAGMLVGYYKHHRRAMDPQALDPWLEHLIGWAEIDSLCQSNFSAGEMLSSAKAWKKWQTILIRFSKSANISKRRASLVLLTKAVSDSADPRLSALAFRNIETLKAEKDILITKAVSWLLRSLVKHHKKETALYIKRNLDSLPKIAIRETTRKILTGRK